MNYYEHIGDTDNIIHIENLYKNNRINELEIIGYGKRSTVFKYGRYAIKLLKDNNVFSKDINEMEYSKNNDILILKKIGLLNGIPYLYKKVDDRMMIMERIVGENVADLTSRGVNDINISIEDLYNDIVRLVVNILNRGVYPVDMHENNLMINYSNFKPYIIDLGECLIINDEKDYTAHHENLMKNLKAIKENLSKVKDVEL